MILPLHRRFLFLWLALSVALGTSADALAAELKLDVRLVWGTNDEKSPNPGHKPADAKTTAKLAKAFKWKTYFLVSSHNVDVPDKAAKKVKLSDQSEVEVREVEAGKIEVKVFGKGKLVRTITEKLSKDGTVVIAGDDKNESAWFILIKNR